MEFDIEEVILKYKLLILQTLFQIQEGIDAQEYFAINQIDEDTILDWCQNSEQDENINSFHLNNAQNSEKCKCLP